LTAIIRSAPNHQAPYESAISPLGNPECRSDLAADFKFWVDTLTFVRLTGLSGQKISACGW
jgi:hypothetical protein